MKRKHEMWETSFPRFHEIAALCEEGDPEFAVRVVDELLRWAEELEASDLHLNPMEAGLEVRIRVDGVLHRAGMLPAFAQRKVVTRMKVLADLLTYRSDVP